MSQEYSPVTVFCGKGGVGKTVLSLAYGLWHAQRGRRAVVVSSHPLGELALAVSLHGLKDLLPEAAANLFVVHVDPREILTSKVRQQIPSKFLADAVTSSRIYRSLVEVAPGLKEIAFLARLRQLAETRSGEGIAPGFEHLIWDAPASGHLIQTLRASGDFQKYLSGPFAVLGSDLADFLSDRSRFSLIPVTTPEEMAVEETIELSGRLVGELDARPEAIVCNMASPLLSVEADEVEGIRRSIPVESLSGGMGIVFARYEMERELFERLRASLQFPIIVVERVAGWNSDLDLVRALAYRLGEALGGAEQ